MMRKAFTLIEVNLAVLVMAGGILSVVVLYSLGYRETRQSREDIVSTGYSDAVLAPVVAALSSKELKWEEFDKIKTAPSNGWGAYLTRNGEVIDSDKSAAAELSKIPGVKFGKWTKNGFHYGLVVSREENSGVVKIGYRTSRKLEDLLTAPLYYTEVRFQGGFD